MIGGAEGSAKKLVFASLKNKKHVVTANKALISKYGDELSKKLREHDLTRLTLRKPGLIEKRVNDATKKVFEELESSTAVQPDN